MRDSYLQRRAGKSWLTLAVCFVTGILLFCLPAGADDEAPLAHVMFNRDGSRQQVDGKVLIEAVDGGILLLGRDGKLFPITAGQLVDRKTTDEPFTPFSREEMGERLKKRLGSDFEITTTRNYILCSRTHPEFAKWCGSLFERLLSNFLNYWKRRGLKLHEPELPLVAIILADERQFAEFAAADVGPDAQNAHGYYSIDNNYVVLYDITKSIGRGRTARSEIEIQRRMAAAGFNTATVIHEATHQIAFNCGMHRRYADNPLWLVEGMAMFFETPDLTSKTGWRTAGGVNNVRLRRFVDYVRSGRRNDSLAPLVVDNRRFTDPATIEDAYAEAWAFSYFLIRTRRQQYLDFLKQVGEKSVLQWDKPDTRLEEFQAAFGDDLAELDRDFLRYIERHVAN